MIRDARSPLPSQPAINSVEGEAICAELETAMTIVIKLIEEETALIRAGRLFAAGELEARKTQAAQRYLSVTERARAIGPALEQAAPVAVDRLRRRHDSFKPLLQFNLAVLATAKAVSENLVRAVADGVALASRPRHYGAAGTIAPRRAAAIAVDRSL